MPAEAPFRVLIAGGGIAGVTALMALADHAERRLEIELVCPATHFVLSPQLIGEPWGGRPLRVPLAGLAEEFGATYRRTGLAGVRPGENAAVTTDGERHQHDAILVATGGTPAPVFGVPTVGIDGVPQALARSDRGSVAVLVPRGTGWTLPAYQLALLTAATGDAPVRVVTPEHRPLEVFGPAAAGIIADFLTSRRVGVELGRVIGPDATDVAALAQHVVALPVPRGPGITGLPADAEGFLPVDGRQRVSGLRTVFAAGDVTARPIKQGGLAAHQAEAAAFEIARLAGCSPVRTDEPATLRGKLTAGEDVLYLRRRLEDAERDHGESAAGWRPDADPGTARDTPLWKPDAAMLAWRLSRWLELRRRGLGGDPLGHLARPLG